MSSNFFFKKKSLKLNQVFPDNKKIENFIINEVKPLHLAKKNDLTFFDSIKYKSHAANTKSSVCITTVKLEKFLPSSVNKIIVKNVLFELANTLKKIYPLADIDYPDISLKKPINKKFKLVRFGNNVLIGKNVKIGKNSFIGSNTIIEHDVKIGNECIIGSGVVIKNSLIGDRVVLQDGSKIGQKGFGFIPLKNKNIKFPHIGKVIIDDDVEIASNCTVDRGSIDDTIIGKNTFIDNQVHIAHNVKIGKNCIITGQVGFAGSTSIGNRVLIGGQAGISGHLTIGDNVKIAAQSGVLKDIHSNESVMGNPAINKHKYIKKYIKNYG